MMAFLKAHRRSVCALAAVLTLILAAAGAAQARAPVKKRPVLSTYATRALLAYEAMQQSFYVPGTGLYRGEPQYAFLWPFSQALAATVSLSHIRDSPVKLSEARRALLVGLRQYLSPSVGVGEAPATGETTTAEQPTGTGTGTGAVAASGGATATIPRSYDGNVAPPVGPGGDAYYDDNEWVGIELARLYELDHYTGALEQAEQIMQFVMSGWQTVGPTDQPLPCPGGVPFSNAKGNVSRNTVTDGPGAELAVQLYRITHETLYLRFAEMAYGWVRQCLLEPSGLYADHINFNGSVDHTLWSYNQGSMMGAGVLLYQATHDGAYLYQARQTARAASAYFPYSRLSNENPFFAEVYFRNLLYLDSVTHDPPGSLPVREYAYYAWTRHRLSDNLFVYGSPPTTELLRQAALVQVYALLATSPSTYF
jgi:glycosyl hydrolase family 76